MTTIAELENKSALLIDVVAETVLDRRALNLSSRQYAWFVSHVQGRVLGLYDRNPRWRKALDSDSNQGRDLVYAFANHWLDAYLQDPDAYEARHA